MTVQDFLKKLGGPAKVARRLNYPLTTVATWQQRNRIPRWQIPMLATIAREEGEAIPASFDDASEDRAA